MPIIAESEKTGGLESVKKFTPRYLGFKSPKSENSSKLPKKNIEKNDNKKI